MTEVLFGNRTGDTFTFDVVRCAAGEMRFRSAEAGRFTVPLVQNLVNACHTLELVVSGNGEIALEGLYVFEPPLK